MAIPGEMAGTDYDEKRSIELEYSLASLGIKEYIDTIDYRVEGKGWETPVFLCTHPCFAGTKIYCVNTYPYLLALYFLKEVFLVFAYTCQNGNSFKPLSTINSGVNELINCELIADWNVKYRNTDRYTASTRLLAYSHVQKVRIAPSVSHPFPSTL